MTASTAAATAAAPASHRDVRRATEIRTTATAVAVLVAILAAGAALDPSGLLAPIGGRGLPVLGGGGVYRWAPLVVGLPVLLAGTAIPVWLAARLGRPAVTARWLFVTTWIAAVGAAGLATAATAVASVGPLLGAHLSAGQALRFAAATSGFAAVKFVLAGPLVAAATALTYRFSPLRTVADTRPAGPRPFGLATAVMFVLTTLAAVDVAVVGIAARWWRGGPVGYAFAGPLISPTAAAGVLGFLAGVAVFVAAFMWVVRAAQRRLAPDAGSLAIAAAVWLAAIAAGFGLGVVDAIVAAAFAPGLAEAGPDSWWISTTLISLATGISYGTTLGAIGAVVTGVAWRWRSVLTVHLGRRWIAAAAVGVLLLALAPAIGPARSPGPPPVTPAAASGGLERLQLLPSPDGSTPATIGDVTGRQVILRGVNVNQLIDYYLRDPAVPATQPLTDADFEQMATMGFNVVRLGLSWSRLEPSRGEFDQAYLRQVRAAVASAKAHGIYTVLDMHEDAWGTALAAPSEQCGGGTTPTTGWDGAPAWATITDATAHCQFMARDLAPAVATAFSNFYTDRDGIQAELVRAWAMLATTFASEPAVAGYDLLNEPGIGANPPVSSALLLGRYYDAAITAIRAAERDSRGYSHLVFFEPSVLWSGLGFDVTPPPGFTSDRQLVFAPHSYSESISMDQSLGLTIAAIERNLAVASHAAASYGAAVWIGEWGWFGDPSVDGAKVARFIAAQNALRIGGAFWVWRQGCGSPETGADATTSGNLVAVSCATGEKLAPPSGFARPLSSAYPRAVPGRLDSLSGGPTLNLSGTVETAGTNCTLDVWVPGDTEPRLTTTGIEQAAARKVPGGWQVTGCAHGRYTLRLEP